MSEIYLEQAVEPGSELLAPGEWYKLADVANCTKIELSLYHRTFARDWWGDITHVYDSPYTGKIEYLVLSVDSAKRSTAQTVYGIPDVQTVSLGNAHVIFFKWRETDGASRIEYHGYIEGNWIHVRDIYITDRTVIPPGPDDPPDPTWEGAVPIKGRYRWFMFAYTRGNEHVEEPEIELPKTYALEDDPYALAFTKDGTKLFVGLARYYSTYNLLAFDYKKGIEFLASFGDNNRSISFIDVGTNYVLTHEIKNDVSDSVFCLYTRNGYTLEKVATSSTHSNGWRMCAWIDDDRFVTGDLYSSLYLFDTSGGLFTELDSLSLGQYPYGVNGISIYENYIAVAQASSWTNSTSKGLGLFKVVGDELQFCDSELPGNEINQAYCATFNYTGEYIVVTTDWKIVLLKREGNSLTVLQSLDKADVISSGADCYEAAFSPVANYIAFADSWNPTQYIWKIDNDQLVFVKTIENNVEEYCYTSTLIWSNDGEYVIVGLGNWYPQVYVQKVL